MLVSGRVFHLDGSQIECKILSPMKVHQKSFIFGRVPSMCLQVLLRENGFGHPSGKLAIRNLTNPLINCSKHSFWCFLWRKQANQSTQKSEGKLRVEHSAGTHCPKSSFANCRAKTTFSRFCSKSSPKDKLCKIAGQSDVLQALVEAKAKSQALQTARQSERSPGSGLNHRQKSSFANCSAKWRSPGSGRNHSQKSSFCKLPGKVTFSRLWLKTIVKSQTLQTVGQSDVLQAPVETIGQKSSFANYQAKWRSPSFG